MDSARDKYAENWLPAVLLALTLPPAIDRTRDAIASSAEPGPVHLVADFGEHPVSPDARQLAAWIAGSRDNANAAFAIVDKKLSSLHVFDSKAHLRASSLILLGERAAPAGRYATRPTSDLGDGEIFWISHENRLSMHPVFSINPAELQLQRLAKPRLQDERKTYGCINVPASFFKEIMRPSFAEGAVVYILPEVKGLQQVFGIDRAAA